VLETTEAAHRRSAPQLRVCGQQDRARRVERSAAWAGSILRPDLARSQTPATAQERRPRCAHYWCRPRPQIRIRRRYDHAHPWTGEAATTEAEASGSEDFAERVGQMMNEAALVLMISVGHRTGLFDVMAAMPAATSAEIAARAGLNERYVREWLGAMTTGRIVDHDGAAGSFSLPADHAACLTRAAGLDNLAVQAQYVGLLALVEDQIVDCFRHGGGVPYSAFPRLQAVMAEDTGAVHDATLIDVTLPLVPGLVGRLEHGIDVADIGCGSGHAVNLMAEAFPRSRFTGFDFSDTGIAAAVGEADHKDLTNVRFDKRDAARLGETARFDFITTFDSVHDQARPDLVLAGIAQALRPGGVYLCVDFAGSSKLSENLDHPFGPFGYTISCMHCMTVSLADGGMGLGAMWGEQKAQEMLTGAGFTSIETAHVDGDIANTYFIATKD
jgi:Methyltransferase domain